MKSPVEDFELQVVGGRLQEVVDDGAVRRILTCRFFRRQRRIGPGVAAVTIDVGRLEEEISRESLRTHLAQRGDVIEDPE